MPTQAARDGKHVALTKCYFCGEGNEIILHKRLGDVSKYHNMVTSMRPCPKCAEFMKQGIIMMTVDDSKSEPNWHQANIPNPHRTGGFFVVREAFIERVFKPKELTDSVLKHRFTFIEHSAAEALGLFNSTPPPPGQPIQEKDPK